jgi:DNA-binding transcriptional MerR regulator
MTFRPIDASKECGVTVNTIRNWCKDYAACLSPGAGVEGSYRVLTEEDIEKLKYIAQLRTENLQKHQIILRLQETTFGHIEPSNSPQIALQNLPITPDATLAPIVAQDYIASAKRRFEALELSVAESKRNQRDYVQGLTLGFLAACGFFAVVLLLALLYGR